ncbi:MAG: radical SAM family heme chaperone HemW [Anaerolineaceae bacterium]
METASVYLHVPFCRHRCAYCDFNTYAGQESRIPDYVKALNDEIRQVVGRNPFKTSEKTAVHTVFFGGGTPSLLTVGQIRSILGKLHEAFDLLPDAEITLEANPGTTSKEYLADLRSAGINRLSMGMQSGQPDELRLIQRQHTFEDVEKSVAWARQAGFENISLDLLFAIPGQSLASWKQSLELAVGLKSEHLSLYSLTIEEGTPFHQWMVRGLFNPSDEDIAADMMEYAEERLEQAGYDHYEISNWARKSPDFRFECRHNLQYWRNLPYFGFGAGAHACLGGMRLANARAIGEYIQRVTAGTDRAYPYSPATVDSTLLDKRSAMQETMMVGLRLTREGVPRERFKERFGREVEDVFGEEINKLVGQGLLEWVDGGAILRLTRRGCFLGNRVFMEFVGE